jgi:hypothetical protein
LKTPRAHHERLRQNGVAGRRDADARRDGLSGEVLRLQGLVGNSAVTALPARAPSQREERKAAVPASAGRDGYTTRMSDGIGTFELQSCSYGDSSSPGSEHLEHEHRAKGR